MGEPAAETPDHGLGKSKQAFENPTRIHQIGNEDEERHRQQQIAVVKTVHGLVHDQAEILMARDQVSKPGGQHRKTNRRAQHRCPDENDREHRQSRRHRCSVTRVVANRGGQAERVQQKIER